MVPTRSVDVKELRLGKRPASDGSVDGNHTTQVVAPKVCIHACSAVILWLWRTEGTCGHSILGGQFFALRGQTAGVPGIIGGPLTAARMQQSSGVGPLTCCGRVAGS